MSGDVVYDPTTGEVLGCAGCRERQYLVEDLRDQLAATENAMKRAHRAEMAAKRMLSEAMESHPRAKEIRDVLDHWGKDHPRSKVPADGPRAQIVKKALGWGYTVADLKRALDGLKAFPCVGPQGGRVAENVPGAKRYDDVQHALGSEERIEKCMSFAEPVPDNVTQIRPSRTPIGGKHTTPAIDRILERLVGVKTTGLGNWTARCPAHEDKHASLSVAQGHSGVVVRCFAGCTAEAVSVAVGVPLSEWFDAEPPKRSPVKQAEVLPTPERIAEWKAALLGSPVLLKRLHTLKQWTPEAIDALNVGWNGERLTLPVRDRSGELVNVCRYLPKGDPKMIGSRGRPRDLFPGPERYEKGAKVWIVEGEPDAVTAVSVGVKAIGLPGVNGWRPEWAERFVGLDVTVCLDCDEPGRRAAAIVAGAIPGARVLDLDSSRSDGWDFTDYVLSGGSSELRGVA